ncbi:MAG: hypothetical protein HRU78_07775 [Gammaproteobacteria bacterium]|nr:MAG: hypothetical protein HRU78_07775 [Gammaproteobacteria bacterium]
MRIFLPFLVFAFLVVQGCAIMKNFIPANPDIPLSTYEPLVDPQVCKGCDYDNDLIACKLIAVRNTNDSGNISTRVSEETKASALEEEIVSTAIGAADSKNEYDSKEHTMRQMIIKCMQERGYSVLQ